MVEVGRPALNVVTLSRMGSEHQRSSLCFLPAEAVWPVTLCPGSHVSPSRETVFSNCELKHTLPFLSCFRQAFYCSFAHALWFPGLFPLTRQGIQGILCPTLGFRWPLCPDWVVAEERKGESQVGMVVCSYNSRPWEAEAGGSLTRSRPTSATE